MSPADAVPWPAGPPRRGSRRRRRSPAGAPERPGQADRGRAVSDGTGGRHATRRTAAGVEGDVAGGLRHRAAASTRTTRGVAPSAARRRCCPCRPSDAVGARRLVVGGSSCRTRAPSHLRISTDTVARRRRCEVVRERPRRTSVADRAEADALRRRRRRRHPGRWRRRRAAGARRERAVRAAAGHAPRRSPAGARGAAGAGDGRGASGLHVGRPGGVPPRRNGPRPRQRQPVSPQVVLAPPAGACLRPRAADPGGRGAARRRDTSGAGPAAGPRLPASSTGSGRDVRCLRSRGCPRSEHARP
jgi:hypothetical protein